MCGEAPGGSPLLCYLMGFIGSVARGPQLFPIQTQCCMANGEYAAGATCSVTWGLLRG
jgi:hypothetical protein